MNLEKLLISFVKQAFNFKRSPYILYIVSNNPRPTHYECVGLLCGNVRAILHETSNKCGNIHAILHETSNKCGNVHAILHKTSNKCGNIRAILHETSNKCGNVRAILHETSNKCGNDHILKHREMSLVILYLTQRH